MEKIKKMKIVRVTAKEFELEDGKVFEHVEPLDPVPSIDEFQDIYDKSYERITDMLEDYRND